MPDGESTVTLWLTVALWVVGVAGLLFAVALVAGQAYYRVKFLDTVVRIFEEKPFFIVPRGQPEADAEDVTFPGPDGLTLRGCYLPARGPRITSCQPGANVL